MFKSGIPFLYTLAPVQGGQGARCAIDRGDENRVSMPTSFFVNQVFIKS